VKREKRVLLVNDDGSDAPGLWALYREIRKIAECVVLAPMREQSGRGHAITVRQSMALEALKRGGRKVGYRLDGTPADCVKLALSRLYRGQIALVISGVNWGANVGHNILYSGTVGAALEAAMCGLPAIAVSLRDEAASGGRAPTHYATAARVARNLAVAILASGLPPGVALNVNVPNLPAREIAGFGLTRQGRETYVDLFEMTRSGSPGADTTLCTNLGGERVSSRQTSQLLDDIALNNRLISITPLHQNLTCESAIDLLREQLGRVRIV